MAATTEVNGSPSAPISRALLRKATAEAIGTFALVFVGCGAIAVDAATGALGHVGVSLAFGLVIGVMIFAVGHVSGAHFNPAVTLAFAAMGRFPWREVPAYLLAQFGAATLAAATVLVTVGSQAKLGATVPSTGVAEAIVIEVVLTFFLMFVIVGVATDARASGQMAALAIGGTVALAALMGGPLTGASMNPARSLGPALLAGVVDGQLIYLLAPPLGAVLGGFAYRFVRCGEPERDVKGCC